ncbi:MAG: hypothetical protein HWN67_09580 [Candidatus Helarchaeota archaeon]|nr:hypothetical protein [Candidatus Helarchaeota archaeon]
MNNKKPNPNNIVIDLMKNLNDLLKTTLGMYLNVQSYNDVNEKAKQDEIAAALIEEKTEEFLKNTIKSFEKNLGKDAAELLKKEYTKNYKKFFNKD